MTQLADKISEYYSKDLQSSEDLRTTACCTADAMPLYYRKLLKNIAPEIKDRFYGCGSPFPPVLEGMTVLDLGCGTGRDCYMLSQLVGQNGRVIGVDMTKEQIEVAQKYQDFHVESFGFESSNVEFHLGKIENLEEIGIKESSIDIVVSNCVLNLAEDKKTVFSEIKRVLKPGGELYFSDVYASQRIPEALKDDKVLVGECLSGALYIEDFRRVLAQVGFNDYRVISQSSIELQDEAIEKQLGMIDFSSITISAFNCELEDRCEDYGQVAYYLGGIDNNEHGFSLDDHHHFIKDKPMLVCSNTAAMLSETRYKKFFKIVGDTSTHFGLFDTCGDNTANIQTNQSACC